MNLLKASATLTTLLGLLSISTTKAEHKPNQRHLRGFSSSSAKNTPTQIITLSNLRGEFERDLMVTEEAHHEHPAFQPLACNPEMYTACTPWSAFDPDTSSTVKIPCGTCISLDQSGTLALPQGLNVEGKLVIPVDDLGSNYNVEIVTSMVLIQGILEIKSLTRSISPTNEAVRFTLYGTDDIYLTPYLHSQNSMVCMGEGTCNVGKKPFVVAGGRLDIDALPDECPSWVRLEDTVKRGVPIPLQGTYPQAGVAKVGCDASGTIVDEDFASGVNGWTGNYNDPNYPNELGYHVGTMDSHTAGDPYFWVHNRTKSRHGPLTNIDVSCMVPDVVYLLSAKVKLVLTPDFQGTKSSCEATGDKCLKGVYYRTDSNDKSYRQGLGGQRSVRDGEWFNYTTSYVFSEDDLTPGISHLLYFDGPEPGIDIMMDDVKFTLAPADLFPPEEEESAVCDELLMNGSADIFTPFTYPANTNARKTHLVVEDEILPDDRINYYFSLKKRYGNWHSAGYILTPSCIAEGDVYTFSVRLRVHSNITVMPKVMMFSQMDPSVDENKQWKVLTMCSPQSVDNGWVTCSSDYEFTAHQASAGLVKLYINVPEDINAVVDYDDFTFKYKLGPVTDIIVPDSVSPCWSVGSEVLITSHTIKYDDESIRTILSSTPSSDNTVLKLNEPIPYAVTTKKDEEANPEVALAVEVALLTRNVVLETTTDSSLDADVAAGKKHGAHFIVYHTPDIAQRIDGIEIRRFGQAGILGKYSLHFHMCGSVKGTVVSRNVVRDSFQRCYVIHGTHNVTLANNVAYNTFGHCYFLEDGAEEDNVFNYNLGALTKKVAPEDKITAQEETDHEPSTFWMTNTQNSWEGNVAAGSEHSGFWFEMRDHVRGPSAELYPNKKPKFLPLKYFNKNVMHSNAQHGFKTYPGAGYAPEGNQAVFRNTMSYRNKRSGVFFHNSRNLALEGGFFSDNRIQVDFDRAPTTRISNATVTGYSPLYHNVVEAGGEMWHHTICPSSDPMMGVQLHSFRGGGDKFRGSVVENVHFEHLGKSTGCQGSQAINEDDEDKGFFDVRNSISGLTFDDETDKLEVCTANSSGGIDFVVIRDLDGSVMDETGYIISKSDRMMGLLDDGKCTPMSSDMCAMSCPGLCLRAKLFEVSPLTSDDLELIVTDTTDPSKAVGVYGYFEYSFVDMNKTIPDIEENTKAWGRRTFHVTVPDTGGPYEARFVLNGQPVWPRLVEVADDDLPGNCSDISPQIEVFQPEVEADLCKDLVVNGDAEDGINGWLNNGGGLAIHSDGFEGQALKSTQRTSSQDGLAQHLDTRCLIEGEVYQFEAKVKMVFGSDGITDPGCNMHSQDGGCPRATLYYKTGPNYPEDESWVGLAEGSDTGSWKTGQWNTMRGSLKINANMASAQSALIYFKGPPGGVNMIVDMVSFGLSDEIVSECKDVVLNETFTDWVNGWGGNGGAYELATESSHTAGDSYFRVYDRTESWYGPKTDFDISCMVPNIPYFLSAKVKLVLASDFQGTESSCQATGDKCLQGVYQRRDSNDMHYRRDLGGQQSVQDGVWFDYTTSYVFSEDDLAPGNMHLLIFNGPEPGINILMDDVVLQKTPSEFLPSEETLCDELLMNGSADMLPPFTYPAQTNAWKTYLVVDSEVLPDNAVNYFFKLKNRSGSRHSAEYVLPSPCIVQGDIFNFSVRLRVHTNTAVRPKVVVYSNSNPGIDDNEQWKVLTHCPSQVGSDGWVTCSANYEFTPHQGSAKLVKVYIKVQEDIYADVEYDDFSFAPIAERE